MQKMGPLGKIAEMIPGMSSVKIPKGLLDVQEGKMKRWKFCLESMTDEELENPEIITSSRIARISKGSHVPASEIRELLRQYKTVKKFFGMAKGGKAGGLGKKELEKMARKMGMGMRM